MFANHKSLFSRDICHIIVDKENDNKKFDNKPDKKTNKKKAERVYPSNFRMVWVASVLIFLLVLLELTGLLYQPIKTAQENMLQGESKKYCVITGIVTESKKGQHYFFMQTEGGESFYVTMPYTAYDETEQHCTVWYPAGTELEVQGELSMPDAARNPGGFDEAAWLRTKKTGLVLQAEQIQLIAPCKGIWQIVRQMYETIESVLYTALSNDQANLALALLTGAKHRLTDTFYRASQQMGIAHIFAVSGLHVGVIGTVILFFFQRFGWMRSWAAFLFLTAGLGAYCMLAGLPASAIRAACMILLAALAMRLYRPANSVNFLAFAAVILLLDNPYLLWSAGFQLSFGVTLVLLVFTKPIERKLHWISAASLRSSIAVVLAAWLGSMPISAWNFYTISFLSPIFNFLLVPMVSAVIPMLFLALFCTLVCPLCMSLWFFPVKCLLFLLQHGTIWLYETLNKVQWNIGQPPVIALLLYAIVLVLLLQWMTGTGILPYRDLRKLMIVLGCVIFLCSMPAAPEKNELLYLDTGQGSCAMLRMKAGEVILFDAGAQKTELASVLAYYGINRVDAIVLSHGDADHIEGLQRVMETVSIGHIFVEQEQFTRETIQELIKNAVARKIICSPVDEKTAITLTACTLILEPLCDDSDSTNRTQLAAILHYPGGTVLFPGDLSLSAVQKFVSAQNHITIWTVPHHGSRYSGSDSLYRMLQQKGVQYAVISAGRDNLYGHPHQEVLDWLDQCRICVFTTAQNGAVLFQLG